MTDQLNAGASASKLLPDEMLPPDPIFGNGCVRAIRPIYETATPNAPIELHRGLARVGDSKPIIHGEASLTLRWTPRPNVIFRFDDPSPTAFHALAGINEQLVFSDVNASAKCIPTLFDGSVEGVVNGAMAAGRPDDLRYALVHLVNWPAFLGQGVAVGDGRTHVAGRAVLESAAWHIKIDPIANGFALEKALKASGGYAITHVGRIERVDGATFNADELEDIVQALGYFLSFCRGCWSSPILSVAMDSAGSPVRHQWAMHMVSAWKTSFSWFSSGRADVMAALFPGFMRRWNQPLWQETLRRAIWWYISANLQHGGMDGGIILAQVALELLAWVIYVEDGHIVSQKGFNELSAADKLRLLVSWVGAPLDVPMEVPALKGLVDKKCIYGPWAFTEIRNRLVHPKDRNDLDGKTDVIIETWQLGLWYLELAILRICEFDGGYGNRLRTHHRFEVEPVPWSKK